jgi:hypothetical protein
MSANTNALLLSSAPSDILQTIKIFVYALFLYLHASEIKNNRMLHLDHIPELLVKVSIYKNSILTAINVKNLPV